MGYAANANVTARRTFVIVSHLVLLQLLIISKQLYRKSECALL